MEKKWCRRYAWVFSLIVLECMACSAEKKISTVDALWPAYTFEEAVEDAETIIYGKVTGKGDTQVEEHVISENKTFREYYRTVTIEVIERIKGDGDSIQVSYLELGGETATQIIEYSGVVPVEVGDHVLLFLRENGSYISPDGLFIEDANGEIIIPQNMIPQADTQMLNTENRRAMAQYCDFIKNALKYQ